MDTRRDALEIFPAYEQLLDARNIPAKAKPYYLRWAKARLSKPATCHTLRHSFLRFAPVAFPATRKSFP